MQEAKAYAIEQATAALKQLLKGEKVRDACAALSESVRLPSSHHVERHPQDHFKDVAQFCLVSFLNIGLLVDLVGVATATFTALFLGFSVFERFDLRI